MNLKFRPARGAADAPALLRVHAECADADGVDALSPEEYRPTLDWYGPELERSDPRDWVIAEADGEVVGYGHTLWDWGERDGHHVCLHLGWVRPAFRGRGVGTLLLGHLEERCREKAASAGFLDRLEIAANASSSELAAQSLLGDHGYFVAFTMIEMRLAQGASGLEAASLPEGYELRSVRPEHHGMIWQCIGDAFDARNVGNPRFAEAIRKDEYEPYFSGDPDLWFVAWELQGERVAGQVLARVGANGVGEVYHVSVGVGHRRKGLARALLLRCIHALRQRGAQDVRLGTRQENTTEAWRLYEAVGFGVIKSFPRWRKRRDAW